MLNSWRGGSPAASSPTGSRRPCGGASAPATAASSLIDPRVPIIQSASSIASLLARHFNYEVPSMLKLIGLRRAALVRTMVGVVGAASSAFALFGWHAGRSAGSLDLPTALLSAAHGGTPAYPVTGKINCSCLNRGTLICNCVLGQTAACAECTGGPNPLTDTVGPSQEDTGDAWSGYHNCRQTTKYTGVCNAGACSSVTTNGTTCINGYNIYLPQP